MTIGTFLGELVKSLFKRPVTERYPFDRKPTPERLRGKLYYDPNKCAGCQLCVRDCPSQAIELVTIDKENKRFVMIYHMNRCTFCDQCVQSCRFDCLDLSSEEWELASLDEQPLTVYYGKEEDIRFLLEKEADAGTGENPCES